MVETLRCEVCSFVWTRPVTRGRKPRVCDFCRRYGNKPAPKVNRESVIYTDGGQKDAGVRDTNNCTVRALANATGRPYMEAHTFMADNGRRHGKGAYFRTVLESNGNKALGHRFVFTRIQPSRGIKTLMERNPHLKRGTWILKMRTHVATLKDGKLYDSFDSSRKDILWAWEVLPAF